MYQMLPESSGRLVALRVSGKLTKQDMVSVAPPLEEKIRENGRRLDEPNQLELNFNRYVSRFSQNVCGIMERFAFDEQIDARMADKELRCEVIKAFARIDRER